MRLHVPRRLGARRSVTLCLAVRGIEAHPSTVADEDSPEWQQLAPRLARQPVQVDLMGRPDLCAEGSLGRSDLPAGVYRQIRLRLVPNEPATGDPVPEVNACGSAGFNCIVRADGRIQPLVLGAATPQLRIATERITGGFVHILPDVSTHLSIEFNASLSSLLAVGDVVQLVPVLTAARPAPCESIDSF